MRFADTNPVLTAASQVPSPCTGYVGQPLVLGEHTPTAQFLERGSMSARYSSVVQEKMQM